jgi:hypothetical protein
MSQLLHDTSSHRNRRESWCLCLATAALVACSGGDRTSIVRSGTPDAPEQGVAPGAPEAQDAPLYALQVVVFDPDFNAMSYVVLSGTLDLDSISLASAREFPGFVSIMAAGGKLLVTGADEPRLTRFGISPDFAWTEEASLSFANQGAATADVTQQFFLNERVAYLTVDLTSRVIWDPTELEIVGMRERSALSIEPRAGLLLEPAFNRTAWIWRGPVVRPFYHRDEEWFEFSPDSEVVVYDPESHEESDIVSVPCPALENATQDEAGYTYFSTWNYEPTLYLFGEGPKPCVARFTPEGAYDRGWTPDLSAWTGGRHPQVLRYIGAGKAVASVLHHEEIEADWSAGYSPDVGDEIVGGNHFHLWLFDLVAETARELEGIEASNAQYQGKTIDGRSFVFLPYDLWGRSRVYELDAAGTATELFETSGWVYDWVRVR